jgi:hypothetical protein
MSNLSPNSRALLREARGALRPKEEDRERVSAALRTRLGLAALPVALGHQVASASALGTKSSFWTVVTGIAASASLVGGLVYVAIDGARTDVPLRRLERATLSMPRVPQPALPSAAPASSVMEPERVSVPDAPTASARRSDRLAQEVTILSRAARELRGGRAAEALKALDEHQRKFPSGALAEERRAAKAQALCALGRSAEAKTELSRLARSSPQSASAARAAQFCARRSAGQR